MKHLAVLLVLLPLACVREPVLNVGDDNAAQMNGPGDDAGTDADASEPDAGIPIPSVTFNGSFQNIRRLPIRESSSLVPGRAYRVQLVAYASESITTEIELRLNGPTTVGHSDRMEHAFGRMPAVLGPAEPGTSFELDVTIPYEPTGGPYALTAVADPDQPASHDPSIRYGRVAGDSLWVRWAELRMVEQFQPLSVGCTARQVAMELLNLTDQAFAVAPVIGLQSPFSLVTNLPDTLAPGERLPIEVDFAPTTVGMHGGRLWLPQDPVRQERAQLIATAVEAGVDRVRSFRQQAKNKLDIVIVEDDTAGMQPAQLALGDQLASLSSELNRQGIDFNLGLTTVDTSPGSTRGELFASTSWRDSNFWVPSPADYGTIDLNPPRGIDAALLALRSQFGGNEEGFLRPDAAGLIVFVSNKDDHSEIEVADAAAQLAALKPAGALVAHAIVAPGTGCGAGTVSGDRYMALAAALGGVTVPICDSEWAAALAIPAATFGLRDRFLLDDAVDEATLEVEVDGQPATTGWSYDAAQRSIVFDAAAVPADGAQITVRYSTPSC